MNWGSDSENDVNYKVLRRVRRIRSIFIIEASALATLYRQWRHVYPEHTAEAPNPMDLEISTRYWKYLVRRYREQLNAFRANLFSTPVSV